MANRINASNLSDLLLPMRQRGNAPGVYFVRLCQWSPEIKDFLWCYHEAARAKGVIIEGQIGNPDERQLSYLTEMLGSAFEPNPAFITQALQKWMPRMSQANRVSFAEAMCGQMDELKRKGKTDSIIRNIYMKVMCWLYYKFERLMPFLGDDNPPRILYECNAVTAHELILLRILSMMGTDILLLEPQAARLRANMPATAKEINFFITFPPLSIPVLSKFSAPFLQCCTFALHANLAL